MRLINIEFFSVFFFRQSYKRFEYILFNIYFRLNVRNYIYICYFLNKFNVSNHFVFWFFFFYRNAGIQEFSSVRRRNYRVRLDFRRRSLRSGRKREKHRRSRSLRVREFDSRRKRIQHL